MKAYPDANVYLSLFLGERNEGVAEQFFEKSLDCLFTVVASTVTFREIDRRLDGQATLLLGHHLKHFQEKGKIQVIRPDHLEEQISLRRKENQPDIGLNDWRHIVLAERHADVLVSNDRLMLLRAKPFVRAVDLDGFIRGLG